MKIQGLQIIESVTTRPEQRGIECNSKLDRDAHKYLAHPIRNVSPGARLFFLTKEPGVANALDKFDQVFWDRFKSGENRGEPKDKIQIHGDDELDALCYLTSSPYIWTAREARRREPEENLEQNAATDPLHHLKQENEQYVGFH